MRLGWSSVQAAARTILQPKKNIDLYIYIYIYVCVCVCVCVCVYIYIYICTSYNCAKAIKLMSSIFPGGTF